MSQDGVAPEGTLSYREQRHRKIASIVSLVVGTALMLLKFWGYNLTDSQSVYSDAMESIVNVVAAASALFVVFYATRPADQDHPYGHGKLEYFSSAFEGGLITFAAVFILVEAVGALIQGHPLQKLGVGLAVVAGAGVINLGLGLYLIKVGKTRSSIALKASGQHVISDFWTSVGVTVGLGLVLLTGWTWLDSVTAIVVGLLLARTGGKVVRESVAGLMDEEDPELLQTLAQIFAKHAYEGVIQIHHVKVIRSGWYHHIDAHLVVPEFWDIRRAHDKMMSFEKAVIKEYPYGGEMNFHLDPCRSAYCRYCDLPKCPIREEEFQERIPVKLEHLRSPDEPEDYRER